MDIKNMLKQYKLREGSIKTVVMTLVFVAMGVFVVNLILREKGQTIPPVEIGDESRLPAIHTVEDGEDLWKISSKYYGSGYNWVDIALENDLSNPNIINEGQELSIPKVDPKLVLGDTPTPQPQEEIKLIAEDTGKKTHKVQSGESLWKIAEKYYQSGYNWVDISKENNLTNPDSLNEGAELLIPDVSAKVKTVVESTTRDLEAIQGNSYEVKAGDNLWTIAVRAYGDGYKWIDISKKNSLKNPGFILPGSKLDLPR